MGRSLKNKGSEKNGRKILPVIQCAASVEANLRSKLSSSAAAGTKKLVL
jgi:hypothetical protein